MTTIKSKFGEAFKQDVHNHLTEISSRGWPVNELVEIIVIRRILAYYQTLIATAARSVNEKEAEYNEKYKVSTRKSGTNS